MEHNKQKTVLIVDDEPAFRMLLTDLFTKNNIHVISAENSQHAFEIITTQKPNLVITDIIMPGESGLDLIEKVRATPEIAQTFFIVLTNSLKSMDLVHALNEKVTIFLQKSDIEPNFLLQKVNENLK